MTAPLSQDLRQRIVRAVTQGSSIRQPAKRLEVSASAAIKLMQRVRQTGSTEPARIGGYRRALLEAHIDELRAIVAGKAGITLREIKAALAPRGIEVKALSMIADMLHRLGLSHKKALRAAEQDRPDVARHRHRWRVWQRYMDGASLVFGDGEGQHPSRCDYHDGAPVWLGSQGPASD
jgi:transposase